VKINGAWLVLNKECNFKCPWCYMKSEWDKKEEMDFSLACKIIDFLDEGNVKNIILLGGEPTLYSRIFDVIEYIKNKKMFSALVSNGVKFSDISFAKKIIMAGVNIINFSAKGGNNEQYKRVTKASNGYTEMIQGYKNVHKLGKDVSFSVTIAGELVDNIEEVINNLVDDGVEGISISLGTPVIDGNKLSGDSIPNPITLAKAYERAYDVLSKRGIIFSFYNTIPLCLISKRVREKVVNAERAINYCNVSQGKGLNFNYKGEIIPCNHFTSHSLCKFGKDFKTFSEFMKLWESPKMTCFRKGCSRFPTKKCSKCSDWDKCGGGCFLNWLYFNPNDYIGGFKSE